MAVGTAATKSIIQKVIARRFKKDLSIKLLSIFPRIFKDLFLKVLEANSEYVILCSYRPSQYSLRHLKLCSSLTIHEGILMTLCNFRLTADKRANWRDVLLAGSIASVINTFGMGWAFDHNFATLGGYFIGDISGMFACMFALMLVFSAQRRSKQA
jgi:hypothetical protein